MADQSRLDKIFMITALQFAQLSNCRRLKVGAVITINNRIYGTGYNGTPAGISNCSEINKDLLLDDPDSIVRIEHGRRHHLFSSQFEIHAEMNAILDMAKRGLSPEGATLYTNIAPCKECAKLVITSGIKRVVYLEEYDRDKVISNLDNKTLEDVKYQDLNGPQIMKLLNSDIIIEQICLKENT